MFNLFATREQRRARKILNLVDKTINLMDELLQCRSCSEAEAAVISTHRESRAALRDDIAKLADGQGDTAERAASQIFLSDSGYSAQRNSMRDELRANALKTNGIFGSLVERESAKANALALYLSPYCGYCHRVLQSVDRLGVKIDLRDIFADPTHRQALAAARGVTTVPVLRISAEDGERWMPESRDIIRYLEKVYGISPCAVLANALTKTQNAALP